MSIVCYKMINFIYDIICRIKDLKSKEMFYDEMQMLVFGLVFWLIWFGDDLLDLLKKSKKSYNPYEEISEEDIYFDQKNKVWLWEVDGHLFSNEEFHMQQGGKIEDFENWIRNKEPIDSIEDVTSYKVH